MNMLAKHTNYIPALTGLRGIAALWVVLHHIWASAGYPNQTITIFERTFNLQFLFSGWLGVDIFFVLSGFVLCAPFLAYLKSEQTFPNMRHYTIRRAARIIPAYYAQLILLALLSTLGIMHIPANASDYLTHAFFIQNLVSLKGEVINGSYWSLPVEVHYYFTLPTLFFLFKKYGVRRVVPLVLIAMFAYRIGIIHLLQHDPIALKSLYLDQIFGRIDQFLIGMGCAYLYTNRDTLLNSRRTYAPVLLCLMGIAGLYEVLIIILNVIGLEKFWAGHPFLYIFRTILGLSVGCLIMGISLSPRIAGRILANPVTYFLGTISYGIYLWHFPVHILLNTYLTSNLHPQGIMASFAVTATLTTIAASVSYFAIERPILNWAGRITKN